jgi:hypothetical protein
MLRIAKWNLPALIISLAACGGSSGDLPPSRPAGAISGSAVDGPIVNGTVSVYSFADGVKGALLGQGTTGTDGGFSIPVAAASQSVLLEVTKGTYVEDADNTSVPLPNDKGLQAIGSFVSGQEAHINITPISHLAVGLVSYRIKPGVAINTAVMQANSDVSALFGFDVVATAPRSIRQSAPGQLLDDGLRYGFLLAGMSSYSAWVSEQNAKAPHEQFPTYAVAQLMSDDIAADGLLDGKGKPAAGGAAAPILAGTSPISQDTYVTDIAQHVLIAAGSDYNKSGYSSAELQTFASSFKIASSPLFVAPPTPVLDVSAPQVSFSGDPRKYYRGAFEFRIAATDESGISQVTFKVDGAEIGAVVDPAAPKVVIDTTKLKDGSHIVTAVVQDAAGNVKNSDFSILVDNSAPMVTVTSPNIANKKTFTMTGTYDTTGAIVTQILAGSEKATLSPPHNWSATLQLDGGVNQLPILVTDEAGNQTRTDALVAVDLVPPAIHGNVVYKEPVYFSLGDGTCYSFSLSTASDTGLPLYFNANKVSVDRKTYTWLDLETLGIPYFRFLVEDPRVSGVYTPADKIVVRMQYEADGKVVVPFKTLTSVDDGNATNPYYLIPLATELLSKTWPTVSPSVVNRLIIEITDAAGNKAPRFTFQFRADFRTAACKVLPSS